VHNEENAWTGLSDLKYKLNLEISLAKQTYCGNRWEYPGWVHFAGRWGEEGSGVRCQ